MKKRPITGIVHPHLKILKKSGYADVARVLEYDGDVMSIPAERWDEVAGFLRAMPYGSTLRDIAEHRARWVRQELRRNPAFYAHNLYKKKTRKKVVRRKRRSMREKRVMQIKRGLMKSAKKLRLGAKRTGAYVYGTLRRIVGNPASPRSLAKLMALEKDGTTRYSSAYLMSAKNAFDRGQGAEFQRLILTRMRKERGRDVDMRRLAGNPGPYSRTILKVLKSPIEAYSRGKRIPDLYEALLIRFGNGELGIMICWRNRNGELVQTPGAWTLDSLKGVSDSIAIDYGQGWTVRGMHSAIAEAKSDALYRIRDLKGNPGFDPKKIIGGAKARKEYYAGLKSGLESRKEMDGGSKWTHLIVGQKNKNDRYLSNVTLREALDRPLIFAYQMGWRTGWNKGWANESYMPRLRGNPPMYAHGMTAHRTHGLSLKQMMKLYRLVSSGNSKAVMYARRALGIPMSESLQQVKAVVYHHVLDLKGKI